MKKKQRALTVILLLLTAGIFSSCKKEEIKYKPVPDIQGKWQLIGPSSWDGEPTISDYLSMNIIYDFQENNVLIVSGEIEGVEEYSGLEAGEHSYHQIPVLEGALPQIKIGNDMFSFAFGGVFFDYYQGGALHLYPHLENPYRKRGAYILVKVEDLNNFIKI
jgi:hypothetical protein